MFNDGNFFINILLDFRFGKARAFATEKLAANVTRPNKTARDEKDEKRSSEITA